MNRSFPLKTGDRLPMLDYTLRNGDGTAPDLTGATVRFSMSTEAGVSLIDGVVATIVNAAGGAVRYPWASGETDVEGEHRAEFEVTFPDGRQATYPNAGYLMIRITAGL